MNEMSLRSPAELIDLSKVVCPSNYIEMAQHLTYGTVTIGCLQQKFNDGALIGTTQYAVLINDDAQFEMGWKHSSLDTLDQIQIARGGIQILPSDVLIYKRWSRRSRMTFIAIDKAFVWQIIEEAFERQISHLEPQVGVLDPVISGMAAVWQAELKQGGAGGRIYAEALATALIVHLFRTYCGEVIETQPVSGGISMARLRRVIDYVEAHLSEDLSLAVLASITGLSMHHFNEVFKAEVGVAPYQYLLDRRIHHAKQMLLTDDASIAQIAFATGFSGQSHFTFNFRKLTGTTPLRYRLEAKSKNRVLRRVL